MKIEDDSQSAAWCCHRGTCGWEGGGSLSVDSSAAPGRSGRATMCCSPHFVLGRHLGVLTGRALSALHTMASVALSVLYTMAAWKSTGEASCAATELPVSMLVYLWLLPGLAHCRAEGKEL